MGRFSIDITEVSEEPPLVPEDDYKVRIVDGKIVTGEGEYGQWANFSIAMAIEDPEIGKLVGMDEPRVYYQGFLSFDKDTGEFQKQRCPELGSFIKVAGFTNTSDFETEETEQAESMFDYIVALVKTMLMASVGTDLIAKVEHKPKIKNQADSPRVNRVTKISAI